MGVQVLFCIDTVVRNDVLRKWDANFIYNSCYWYVCIVLGRKNYDIVLVQKTRDARLVSCLQRYEMV